MNEASPQPTGDTAEKRRKQIEKAKAAHLSRQLQTRLQYARLKVDHGWQKQTLNEVENLYFHHYRARIPPRSVIKQERNAGATSSAQASAQSSAQAKLASSSNSNSIPQEESQQTSGSAADPSSAPAAPDESEPPGMDVDQLPTAGPSTDPPNSTVTASHPQSHHLAPSVLTPPNPNPPLAPKLSAPSKTPPLTAPPGSNQTHNPAASTPNSSFSTFSVSSSKSRTSSYPQPLTPSMQSRGPSPSTRPSPSTTSVSLPGSSNVALTYDSFWSSHSSTSNNYRSVLANANLVTFTGLGRGDADVGGHNFASGYPYAISAPSAQFQPLPLPKGLVGRKRSAPAAAALRQGSGEGGG